MHAYSYVHIANTGDDFGDAMQKAANAGAEHMQASTHNTRLLCARKTENNNNKKQLSLKELEIPGKREGTQGRRGEVPNKTAR